MIALDDVDRALLIQIQENDRLSYAALGKAVGLSVSGVNARLKRLMATGVIRCFAAILDPVAVGRNLCAFVEVVLERPEHDRGFIAAMATLPDVLECHHVTGDYSYLLKLRVGSPAALERVIADGIKAVPGVARTSTVIALSSPKETTALDLGGGDGGGTR